MTLRYNTAVQPIKTEFPGNLPFRSIGQFYRAKFGSPVQTLPVTIASDCPNRRGLRGMKTCVFCDVWGSSAYPSQRELGLKEQIEDRIRKLGPRYGSQQFLVYFQAYTNTFVAVQKLRESFEMALSFPQVKGFIVGTRPDCLSKATLDLWEEYSKRAYVSVELGVQTFDEEQLLFLRRGHTGTQSVEAIHRIAETGIDLGVHLIFGIPGETKRQMEDTANLISELPVHSVKLHNLHVLTNTPLAEMYAEGKFEPASLETYSDRVIEFLEALDPSVWVQRLAALSSRWDELVAPEWNRHKMKTYNFIVNRMREKQSYQGKLRDIKSLLPRAADSRCLGYASFPSLLSQPAPL